ncbi:hypothetical protein [Nocardioides pakistanensis]
MAGVTALEVRMMQGETRPALAHFTSTLGQLSSALREIDRAAVVERVERPKWVVDDLSHEGMFYTVRLTARPSRRRDPESLLRPVAALVDGARDLQSEPELPPFYSEATVTRLLKVAEPKDGIREVSLATVNGTVGDRVGLNDALIEHARSAVREAEVSIGSITGTLDVISTRAKHGVRVSVFDPVNRRAVTGTASGSMSDNLRNFWGHRVTVRGRITRNARGQAIRIAISDLELLPDDDSGRPSTTALLGADPEWTGGLSVDEFMNRARRRA